MKLSRESVEWAIVHLDKENDTDIFPKPPEIKIIKDNNDAIVQELTKIDIGSYKWKLSRRLLIAKDELSHRVITQLDPLDSIYLSAIIKEFGHLIEKERVAESEEVVYGNRFAPSDDGLLYKSDGQWKKFWNKNRQLIEGYKYAVRFDIADFYNQIYHHPLENILIHCGFSNEVKRSISSFLTTLTFKVSRGIPVGPHSTHLLAEAVLINVDNSLKSNGIKYTRYMDDFIAFSNSELECRIILNKVAGILDIQRLILQRHKTKIFDKENFLTECDDHLTFEPLSDIEEQIASIIKEYNEDNPYGKKIDWDELEDDEKDSILNLSFNDLINKYLYDLDSPDYSKLRWVYRILRQLGAPQAIEYTLNNIDNLTPVINDVCAYFISSASNYNGDIKKVGNQLHKILNSEIVMSNEYLQISIMNLFSQNTGFNHFEKFACKFNSSSENIKREIILIAGAAKNLFWLKAMKDKYNECGSWGKRALLISFSCMSKDERKFLYGAIKELGEIGLIEKVIIDWGKTVGLNDDLPF